MHQTLVHRRNVMVGRWREEPLVAWSRRIGGTATVREILAVAGRARPGGVVPGGELAEHLLEPLDGAGDRPEYRVGVLRVLDVAGRVRKSAHYLTGLVGILDRILKRRHPALLPARRPGVGHGLTGKVRPAPTRAQSAASKRAARCG